VRCQDVAGNANTNDFTISFSVASAAAGGPVAAYSFNQGSGTAIPDASGNGNNATVTGATWTTAGRTGAALVFNGTSSRVVGPTLPLGSAFTLMAWVLNPSRTPFETIVTIGGSRDLYLANGVITFWDGTFDRAFGTAIPSGAWQHVAVVSDGTTLRAYLNGAARGSVQSVGLGAASGTLQVGAWLNGASPTDFFAGTIDEIRVFTRALTQAEVQSLTNTAITP
jgi:hypothetical protein